MPPCKRSPPLRSRPEDRRSPRVLVAQDGNVTHSHRTAEIRVRDPELVTPPGRCRRGGDPFSNRKHVVQHRATPSRCGGNASSHPREAARLPSTRATTAFVTTITCTP